MSRIAWHLALIGLLLVALLVDGYFGVEAGLGAVR